MHGVYNKLKCFRELEINWKTLIPQGPRRLRQRYHARRLRKEKRLKEEDERRQREMLQEVQGDR